MSRIAYCAACAAHKHDIKTRIALEHTCGLSVGEVPDETDQDLPQEVQQRIVDDGIGYAESSAHKMVARVAYITGATAEAEKALALVTFINKFISRHEAGLLPDRFLYDEGLETLKSYNDEK